MMILAIITAISSHKKRTRVWERFVGDLWTRSAGPHSCVPHWCSHSTGVRTESYITSHSKGYWTYDCSDIGGKNMNKVFWGLKWLRLWVPNAVVWVNPWLGEISNTWPKKKEFWWTVSKKEKKKKSLGEYAYKSGFLWS